MGGRSNKNRMQAIGGVKGREVFSFLGIQAMARYAIQFNSSLNNSILQRDYSDKVVFYRAAFDPSINFRDGLDRDKNQGVALQFVYEEADWPSLLHS